MKRIKVLVVASAFAVMSIGAANSFAQTLREDAIIIELPRGINGRDGGDVDFADDFAPATETPDDPEPLALGVSVMYNFGTPR